MSRFQNTGRDDNDSRLFDTLEDYILEHYPNPERVGCLDQDVLRRLVETPEQLDLGDPKYLHVFKCAECTRELRRLRHIREARILEDVEGSPTFSDAGLKTIEKWRQHIVTAASETRIFVHRFVNRLKRIIRG